MKLVIGSFVSLDGVMQAPGGPEEDPSRGFKHGGWMVPYFDEALMQRMVEWCTRADALLLGRRTYEIFAAHWPYVTDPGDAVASTLNRVPKHVATRTLESLAWANSTRLEGDTAQAVASLKQQPGGELQVHGSSDLIQTLLANDLVDELRLWIAPLVLGKGKSLFGTGAMPVALRLVETQTISTGAILHVYRRSGDVDHGSFAFEQPTAEEVERRKRMADEGEAAI